MENFFVAAKWLAWLTSIVNVLWGSEEVSTVEILVKIRSVRPMIAFSAGTNDPT